ncbi:GNAT family protein [Soonwooa sp.]|uniref:GNAT family N-acetyltransferase n=1 Tax=Soonwooa sp. TaxID=1938592 RepID=UPI0028A22D79|nr:GNAT family protein [Soonwooa sp.]
MDVSKTLYTSRLLIRPIEDDDITFVHRALSNPIIYNFLTIRYDTLEATKEQMEWYKHLSESGKGFWWAICDKNTNEFLGACGFSGIIKEHQKAEGGYWLLPEYWGKGYIAEAFDTACEYAHKNMRIKRIECVIEPENENSKKIMTKLNFKFEGRMRQAEIKDGKFIDIDVYSKLRNE